MRHTIVAILLTLGLLGAAGVPEVTGDVIATTVHAQELEIRIGEEPWYEQPVWLAIAIIGGLVVVLLVVMALRGRGSRV